MINKSALKIILLSLVLTVMVSCKKEEKPQTLPDVAKSESLKISDNFNWQTFKAITVEIAVESDLPNGSINTIYLYRDNPNVVNEPIASGSAGFNYPYSMNLMVPSYLTGLWVRAKFPDGSSEVVFQPFQGSQLSYTFIKNTFFDGNLKSAASGPDCTTGCDQVISGNGQVTIKNGQTYCVTASFSGNINFEPWNGGGTLRVCGTANPQNINQFGNNCNIIIADGGTFTISNLTMDGSASLTAWHSSSVTINSVNMNQQSTNLLNYSNNFKINGTFSPNGVVNNCGTMTITGDYNGNSANGHMINSGTMTISGSMNMNHNLTNSGSISINQNLNLNTNHVFINNCKIIVQGSANLNSGSFTMNSGYLKVNNTYTVNGNAQFTMQNQSMVSATNMTLNYGISGAGSSNTIKTTGVARINGGRQVSGPIEWADNDGVLANGNISQFVNGATFKMFSAATNYVPTSACNPEGFGTPPVSDADGDGVPDNDDAYPSDASRAYNNYYPSATGWSTLAFEDLWPSYGDFDMNDLVVNVRFNRITNAQNKVVDLVNTYHITAVGGSMKNGFAFQLDDLNIGDIQSVSGFIVAPGSYATLASSGLENGTTKPVVIVWDNSETLLNRAGGSFFNTEKYGHTGTSDPVTVTVHFATPQNASVVGLAPYNHFLIRNQVREHEIHLPGYLPTSKANTALFGTGNDDTNPANGKYYKSVTNLPWGIFIAEEFDYPVEKRDIVTAHLRFAAWAQSGGTQYPDWYQDKPGYRNSENIY